MSSEYKTKGFFIPNSGIMRSDLIIESAPAFKTDGAIGDAGVRGATVSKRECGCFVVTDVSLNTPQAASELSKPMGRYITLEPKTPLELAPSDVSGAAAVIAGSIALLVGGDASERCAPDINVLVVGLGNSAVTPDSLGPAACGRVLATRHIKANAPHLFCEGMTSVCRLSPGVMGDTGIDAQQIINAVAKSIGFDLIIGVDALARADAGHLGKTIQLTDTGISPGSGVMNARAELSQAALGIPTVAIGVPTMADIGSSEEPLMVTPKSISGLIKSSAELIGMGINAYLQPGLTASQINLLLG